MQREEDRGRVARRIGLNEWLKVAGILMTAAAVIWQGGRIVGEIENVASRVRTLEVSVSGLRADFNREQLQTREVTVRIEGHDRDIGQLERRVSRVERRGE